MAWFVLCMGMGVGRKGDLDAFLGSDEDSGDFHNKARTALVTLAARPRGKLLLNVISELVTKEFYGTQAQSDKRIRIRPAGGHGGQAGSGWSEELWLLQWNPEPWKPDAWDDPEGNFDQLKGIPPHIILGHELIHASHSLMGQTNYTQPVNSGANKAIEECRTIGLPPFQTELLTENALRSEWSCPPRTTFQGVASTQVLKGTAYQGAV
jgi:hypothetical protein